MTILPVYRKIVYFVAMGVNESLGRRDRLNSEQNLMLTPFVR